MMNAEGRKGLAMRVTEGAAGEARVILEGVLDRETVPDIRRKLLRIARREDLSRLVVDFSQVGRLDTAGVAVMVEVLRAVSQKESTLSVDGLSEEAKRLFRLARLEDTFRVGGEPQGGE